MPLSQRRTLTRYLIEERRRFPQASGDLNALILDVSLACKAIARVVSFGVLGDTLTAAASLQPRDAIAGDIFVRMNEWSGQLAGMSSIADAEPQQIGAAYPRGKYLLVFNPLDGAGNADVAAPVGSVFSILRAPGAGRDATVDDFLQAGSTQVAAGYAIYGPTTMLVLSVGNGVAGFTLNPNLGEFVLTQPGIRIPDETNEFAIDSSNSRHWEPPVKRYVDECGAGSTGPRGKDFNMRWVASPVAEAHRILLRGGVFLHPHDGNDAEEAGRLRLLHEANPIGFIVEQAGGRASTGRQALLALQPSSLQQRIAFVFGSKSEVERIERYYRDPDTRAGGVPLFTERSLFRS